MTIQRDIRIAAVADYLIGKSLHEIYCKHRVTHGAVLKWVRDGGFKSRRSTGRGNKVDLKKIYRRDGTMKLQDVESSNIEAAGYDPESKEMQVRFRGGSLYSYGNVPKSTYDGFLASESKGSFFHGNIKNGGFKWHKVE